MDRGLLVPIRCFTLIQLHGNAQEMGMKSMDWQIYLDISIRKRLPRPNVLPMGRLLPQSNNLSTVKGLGQTGAPQDGCLMIQPLIIQLLRLFKEDVEMAQQV